MISIQELRDVAAIPVEHEAGIDLLKSTVIAQWESMTGIKWARAEEHEMTVEVGSIPTAVIFLPAVIVASIDSVETRSLSVGAEFEAVESTDWILIGPRTLRRLGGLWSGLVRVTADVGYDVAPPDVRRAIALQAKFLIERHSGPKFVEKYAQIPGGGSAGWADADLHPAFALAARIHARVA